MTEHQQESLLGTILAVIGFLIIAFIAVWGLAHMLVLAKNTVSPWFSRNSQAIVISAPSVATSTIPFALSWKHTPTAAGSYTFLYSCVSGVRFEAQHSDGSTTKIPCGAGFTASSSPLTLVPHLTVGSRISTPVSILFKPSTASQTLGSLASNATAEGSASITVVRGTSETTKTPVATPKVTATKSVSKSTKQTVPATSQPAAPADLSVTILAIGVIDAYTGQFVERAPYSPNEIAAVRFSVKNVGGRTSGTYRFSAELPTDTAYVYESSLQSALAPQSYIVNTLRFDRVSAGGIVRIVVTPNGNDSRTSNNVISRSL